MATSTDIKDNLEHLSNSLSGSIHEMFFLKKKVTIVILIKFQLADKVCFLSL